MVPRRHFLVPQQDRFREDRLQHYGGEIVDGFIEGGSSGLLDCLTDESTLGYALCSRCETRHLAVGMADYVSAMLDVIVERRVDVCNATPRECVHPDPLIVKGSKDVWRKGENIIEQIRREETCRARNGIRDKKRRQIPKIIFPARPIRIGNDVVIPRDAAVAIHQPVSIYGTQKGFDLVCEPEIIMIGKSHIVAVEGNTVYALLEIEIEAEPRGVPEVDKSRIILDYALIEVRCVIG